MIPGITGPIPPIPLTVITGFLGAGKTTLINRLLKDPALADTVVIVNEFGEIGLDHLLMETVDDGMVLMQSGCLCCTIRGDLVNTLEGLLRKRDNNRITPFRRVLIETTGLADPAPILQTVMSHPYLGLRYGLEGVVTLVDAVNGMSTLDNQPEALKQAAVADRLVITKMEMLSSSLPTASRVFPTCAPIVSRSGKPDLDAGRVARNEAQGREGVALTFPDKAARPPPGRPPAPIPPRKGEGWELVARLRALNPAAIIHDAQTATAADLLDCGLYDPATKSPDVARWLRDEAVLAALGRNAHRHADGSMHADGDSADAAASARGQDHNDINRHDASIRAHAFSTDRAIAAESFALFQELLRSAHGPKLLRLKAIVKIAESPESPVVIHGVQHVFHPPVILERWPDQDRRTRMVFITKDLEPGFVEGLWAAFLGV
jgi:G3E family GTPase